LNNIPRKKNFSNIFFDHFGRRPQNLEKKCIFVIVFDPKPSF